jgi:hypothetical protein
MNNEISTIRSNSIAEEQKKRAQHNQRRDLSLPAPKHDRNALKYSKPVQNET